MIDGEKYESYLDMDKETKRLCIYLLLHEYLENRDYTDAQIYAVLHTLHDTGHIRLLLTTDEYAQIYAMMKGDLKRFEKAEQFEMCALVRDAIKFLFK